MGVLKEFKEFAFKGNVIDLAVAFIIGAAFSAIVSSLVEDVITPLLLTPALEKMGAEKLDQLTWGAVKYGNFLAAVIKFLLVAFVLYLVISVINKKKKKEDPAPAPGPTTTEILLMEIRDSLKK